MFLSFFSVYDGPYWWHYYAALSPFLISLVQWIVVITGVEGLWGKDFQIL
jgi:hypothetical protein